MPTPLPDELTQENQAFLGKAFAQNRDRLKRMVRLRLDQRLLGRVDDSDVVQDAYLEASQGASAYLSKPSVPMYIWLRGFTIKHLIATHRRHLGAKARTAIRDVQLGQPYWGTVNASSLALELVGQLSSPSHAAMKAEHERRVQDALQRMDACDREVLTLRHFEQLNNNETAIVLQIEESAASKRYTRALKRLQVVLTDCGLVDHE